MSKHAKWGADTVRTYDADGELACLITKGGCFDREYIVRAVNAHEALLAACEAALTEMRRMRDDKPDLWEAISDGAVWTAWDKLRAAIALAKGGSDG